MALNKDKLNGIFVPMVTPTDNEDNVDRVGVKKLVKYLLDGGVNGLVPLGGTGEYVALSPVDRAMMVEAVVEEAGGRVPVMPGVLSPGFKEAVSAGIDFKRAGADAIMLLTPYYIKPSQDGICKYFSDFISRVKLPVLIYDIPYRTGVYLEPATIKKIADDNGMVIGMKACNTDLAHFAKVVALVGEEISVLSGEDYLFLAEVMMGARGGIIATANAFPSLWVKMFQMIKSGEIDEAKRIHFGLLSLMEATFAETNPGPLKEIMGMLGVPVGRVLRPLMNPNQETLMKIKSAIQKLSEKPLSP